MSLVSSEGEGEQNEIRILQEKLGSTMKLVSHLTAQLNELKEQVCSQALSHLGRAISHREPGPGVRLAHPWPFPKQQAGPPRLHSGGNFLGVEPRLRSVAAMLLSCTCCSVPAAPNLVFDMLNRGHPGGRLWLPASSAEGQPFPVW